MGMNLVRSAVWGITLKSEDALQIFNDLTTKCNPEFGLYVEVDSDYFQIELLADDSMYGESLNYIRHHNHVFGISYAQGQHVKDALSDVPDNIKVLFEKFGNPYLKEMNIEFKPDSHLIIQTY